MGWKKTLAYCTIAMLLSTTAARRLAENSTWFGSGGFSRKSVGMVIGLLGIYFIGSPFLIG